LVISHRTIDRIKETWKLAKLFNGFSCYRNLPLRAFSQHSRYAAGQPEKPAAAFFNLGLKAPPADQHQGYTQK
jgi:hypothetical protein